MDFREFFHCRPVLLDAGMGTRLIARGLDVNRCDPSAWCIEAPDLVRSVHWLDRCAGSDALFTNSFGAHRSEVAHSVKTQVDGASVRLAREVAGQSGFVVASLGPRTDWSDADLSQVGTMIDGGVDALALETMRPIQALKALAVLRDRTRLPIIVSIFMRPVPDYWREARDAGADVLGVNCVSDFDLIRRILDDAAQQVEIPLLVKPSAGLPGKELKTPEAFAREAKEWMLRGARLIGGCCGTTERHIEALRAVLDAESASFRPDKNREFGL